MRSVSFNVRLPDGSQLPVACGAEVGPLEKAATVARAAGQVKVSGEAVPIVGGIVFASDGFGGPVIEFSCDAAKPKRK